MRIFLITIGLWLLAFNSASAQDLKIADVFRQMPDSLMPYLTENNRLDFIDFLDSNMKAEVRNSLGGTSEMTSLADDSLSIRMSNSARIDMFLMKLDQPIDSITQVIAVIETFMVDSIYGESTVKYYTPDWKRLAQQPPLNEAQENKIHKNILQNLLKREEDLLNKR